MLGCASQRGRLEVVRNSKVCFRGKDSPRRSDVWRRTPPKKGRVTQSDGAPPTFLSLTILPPTKLDLIFIFDFIVPLLSLKSLLPTFAPPGRFHFKEERCLDCGLCHFSSHLLTHRIRLAVQHQSAIMEPRARAGKNVGKMNFSHNECTLSI